MSKISVQAIIDSMWDNNHMDVTAEVNFVQLVAPVVAQMMFGIPGLAIVGGILIVCKKRYAHFFAESQPALTTANPTKK